MAHSSLKDDELPKAPDTDPKKAPLGPQKELPDSQNHLLRRLAAHPPGPLPPPAWLQELQETKPDAPRARFVDHPSFPADQPLGYPHIIDTEAFTSATDPCSFRLCDAVATVLHLLNRALCELYFCENSPCIKYGIADTRVSDGTKLMWQISRMLPDMEKADGAETARVRVDFNGTRRFCIGYAGEVAIWTGEWTAVGVRHNNGVDNGWFDPGREDMELYGACLGAKMLTSRIFERSPWYHHMLLVNDEEQHMDWPKPDIGPDARAMRVGLRGFGQQLGMYGATRPPSPELIDDNAKGVDEFDRAFAETFEVWGGPTVMDMVGLEDEFDTLGKKGNKNACGR